MRVVAGTARGRTLQAPPGRTTRPTSDRVREAVFDILGSLIDLDGLTVVDLFAGSGALGIEAWSRGATPVTFVEHDRRALAVLRANVATLGIPPEATRIVAADAPRWAETGPPGGGRVGLVLADPPYAFAGWDSLARAVARWADLLVAETGHNLTLPAGWVTARQRRYGATVVTVARQVPVPPGPNVAKGGM